TAICEFSWSSFTASLIVVVDLVDSSANFLISSATTANPLPSSPALAASIAAFRASKLVCSAIEEIIWLTSLICSADSLVILFICLSCLFLSCLRYHPLCFLFFVYIYLSFHRSLQLLLHKHLLLLYLKHPLLISLLRLLLLVLSLLIFPFLYYMLVLLNLLQC